MLSKAHSEESSIKTVTLARASYSGSSPSTSFPGVISAQPLGSFDKGFASGSGSPEVCYALDFDSVLDFNLM